MAKILIVDDSRTSRKILRGILEGAGHQIVGEAMDGEEGVAKYAELKPDIVTMDITMPKLDGIASIKKIIETDSKAKVIMVTAAGQKEKVVEAIKIGAAEYITKPYDGEKLLEAINNILK